MRIETIGDATLYLGDCRDILPSLPRVDAVITDPPYGVTSLKWGKRVDGWDQLLPADCLWCFGSMAFFLQHRFEGWKYAQEIVWEKHNGSGFHTDRFRRVHELAVMFYRGNWASLHHDVPTTLDAVKRTARRKSKPAHMGDTRPHLFTSETGGKRLMRSVLSVASCHGFAEHPTQKPVEIICPLVTYSCPPKGTVVDSFMGSGTTGVACAGLGRKFIGIEIDEKYFDIACERIRMAYIQGRLFA